MEWFHFIESFDTAVKCFVEHIINQLHSLGLDVLMHMVHNITLVYRSVVMI